MIGISVHLYTVEKPHRLFELVEQKRKDMGLSQAEVANRAFGRSDSSSIQNLRRGKSPSVDNMEAICRVLGLDFYIGPKRTAVAPRPTLEIDGDDFVAIPLYTAAAAAGDGVRNDTEEVERHILFRRDWLRGLGVALKDAALLRAKGDSMFPAIQDGDLMMIDTSRREVPTAAQRRRTAWVIRIDGELRVKWVHRPDKSTLILTSENDTIYAPEILRTRDGAHPSLIGQVMWWGHTER